MPTLPLFGYSLSCAAYVVIMAGDLNSRYLAFVVFEVRPKNPTTRQQTRSSEPRQHRTVLGILGGLADVLVLAVISFDQRILAVQQLSIQIKLGPPRLTDWRESFSYQLC